MGAEQHSERLKRLSKQGGWVGVDLDGTLATYNGFQGAGVIGPPIPKMVNRVLGWLADGVDVRVFTARADDPVSVAAIEQWCAAHIGKALPVTNRKDHNMIELWDDRAIQVRSNTGERADGEP